MNKLYAIRTPFDTTSPFVSAVQHGAGFRYSGMGKMPTIFASRAMANQVVDHYKTISKNSGKTPTELRIVEVQVAA